MRTCFATFLETYFEPIELRAERRRSGRIGTTKGQPDASSQGEQSMSRLGVIGFGRRMRHILAIIDRFRPAPKSRPSSIPTSAVRVRPTSS